MKKKVVALMTIATMAASLFAGCGEQTQNVGGGTETEIRLHQERKKQ